MNFYFYDYETFGANPKTSRIAQFAGIRTDEDFNIISEKMLYCQPTRDVLPDPVAVNVTGITPQLCQQKGLIEKDFIAAIHQEFSTPQTCIVGYNNIRFDDEFTRHTLFRNFFNPYGWAWKNGNSRWDLLDVVRMCYGLKPDTLRWAFDDDIPSFKLDRLAPANNIHIKAHDALEDVRATIAIAKIIKQKQPKLFAYALSLRDKKTVAQKIALFKPMLHTSGMYPAKLGCTRRCVTLGFSSLGNAIVFNLDQDPSVLLDLSVDELKTLQFSKTSDLPQGVERLQIKEMHPNKSPMFIANVNKISPEIIQRLQIDMEKTTRHLEFILEHKQAISQKVKELYQTTEFPVNNDSDQSLYNGFLSNTDRKVADEIVSLPREHIAHFTPEFESKNLQQLWIHFKARNYPDALSEVEREYWFEVVQERVQMGGDGYLGVEEFEKSLSELKMQYPEKSMLWKDLEDYIQEII
jgi:exodeoxyribonuclease-1